MDRRQTICETIKRTLQENRKETSLKFYKIMTTPTVFY